MLDIINGGQSLIDNIDVPSAIQKIDLPKVSGDIKSLVGSVSNNQLASFLLLVAALYIAVTFSKKILKIAASIVGILATTYLLAPDIYNQILSNIRI